VSKLSPTQRSLAKLRAEGCDLVQVVERWNAHAGVRQDLFGVVDILAIKDGETIAVQSTSGANVNARVDKIADSEAIAHIRKAGWTFHVHGWRKVKVTRGGKAMKWECRVVDVS
jgi:hypothetical protein